MLIGHFVDDRKTYEYFQLKQRYKFSRQCNMLLDRWPDKCVMMSGNR